MPDLYDVTYTDDNGDPQNAYAYLVQDGNLAVPGGRYGSDTRSCAPIAIMLFVVMCDGGGEDSVHALDGDMGLVVNGHDEVCWTILDSTHALEGLTVDGEPLQPADYFSEDEIAYARELYSAAYNDDPTF